MNTTISQTNWRGLDAWVLENEILRTIVVPELGAKLVSLLDKRSQREWLVDPGERPFQKVAYGAPFEKQDMSGWDDMFPTISACEYPGPGEKHGVALPDHGEVWSLPWTVTQACSDRLALSVEGKGAALPVEPQYGIRRAGDAAVELPIGKPGARKYALHLGGAPAVCQRVGIRGGAAGAHLRGVQHAAG